jgi:drug/metabolite transporter (DMT)-like permease
LATDDRFLTDGVRAMFLSTLFFALANVFVKQVSHIPAMEVVFFRCAIGAAFCWYGLRRAGVRDMTGSNKKILFLRGAFGTGALFLFFTTLQNIPLASAMTLQYLSPIFTSVIAIFILSESVKALQWLFYAVAFAGVVFIHQFDTRVSLFFLVLGVTSALFSGVAYNLVRTLRGKEHPLTVVLHFQLVGMVAGGVVSAFNWRTPQGWDWAYLFLVGLLSQMGQIFLTNALQKERAASVSIINYSGLVYALLIGWFIFGEPQPAASLAGMGMVIIGVIASIIYNNRRPRTSQVEAT